MARQKGTANFSGTLEVLAGGPIDSRTVVPTLADLTVASNFPYAYVGMETYVISENKKYRLIAADVTQSSSWEEVGSGGGSEIEVDDALSSTSENPVQNKVITTALSNKVDAVSGKGLSSNDYTNIEKNKLAGLSNYDDTEVRGLINGKQDRLTAGNGIDITGNVISAGIPIVANQFDKANIYSTTEKIVGCWTDGRPIYQKTIPIQSLPNNDSISVPHGISNLGTVVDAVLVGMKDNGAIIATYDTIAKNQLFSFRLSSTDIIIYSAPDRSTSGWISHITLQYTKTTDAANSFKYADENDYSTTEHIVGTWIDGKPVYQKTIDCGALPNARDKIVPFNIDNLKRIIKLQGYAWRSTGNTRFMSLPYTSTTVADQVQVDYNSGSGNGLRIRTASNFTDFTETYITLQYTKTTD